MRVALTREVSRSLARCELTHLRRQPIDVERARAQHAAYERSLARFGCAIERLAEEPGLPDAVFVEDTALVLDEVAVLLRPGAASRRAEVAGVAAALARHRPLVELAPPGTVDGGDVLRAGRTLFVGRSGRTDGAGLLALAGAVAPYGYEVRPVAVSGCLHLKSAITAVGDGVLLAQPEWVDLAPFAAFEIVTVAPGEPFAANALRLGDTLLYPTGYPDTAARLVARGFRLEPIDLSELAKAEGAVTCCSLIFASSQP